MPIFQPPALRVRAAFIAAFTVIIFLVGFMPAQAATYKVEEGDTLKSIAASHGLGENFGPILARNPQITNPDSIFEGQSLEVPDSPTQPVPEPAPVATPVPPVEYTPVAGDTLFNVAKTMNVHDKDGRPGYSRICDANGFVPDVNTIRVGQTLSMPTESTTPRTQCVPRPGMQPASLAPQAAPATPAPVAAPVATPAPAPSNVMDVARRFIGTPYVWGGTTPAGFDCSGFVGYVFRQIGVNLPRTADAQLRSVRHIAPSEARPGDLVFWTDFSGVAYHVGIFAGGNQTLIAAHSGTTISFQPLWGNPVYGRV